MTLRALTLTVLLIVAVTGSAKAQLGQIGDSFGFSITDNVSTDAMFGKTITGFIAQLQENASSAPTEVVLISTPAGLGTYTGVNYLYPYGWTIQGTFTVSDGTITGVSSGGFIADLPQGPNNPSLSLFFDQNGESGFVDNSTGAHLTNTSGFSGIVFNPASIESGHISVPGGKSYNIDPGSDTSVPEPSQYGAFFFLAVATLIVWRRFSGQTSNLA